MNILKLVAQLALDGRGFKAGMREAEVTAVRSANSIGSAFSSAVNTRIGAALGAGAIAAGFGMLGRSIANTATTIKDFSEQTDLSTDDVQRLGLSAARSGLSFNDFQRALNKSEGARREAAESSEKLREVWKKYGVTLNDLQNPQLKHIDLLKKVSETAAGMNLSSRDREELKDIFGDKAARLISALQDFGKGKRPGDAIFSEEDIKRIDVAAKKMEELKNKARAAGSGFVAAMADSLSGAVDTFSNSEKYSRAGALLKTEKDLTPEEESKLRGYQSAFIRSQRFENPEPMTQDSLALYDDAVNSIKKRRGTQSPSEIPFEGPMPATAEEKLYEDRVAKAKELEEQAKQLEILKAQKNLYDAILQSKLKNSTATEKQSLLEKEITKQRAVIASLEAAQVFTGQDFSAMILNERAKLVGMESDIPRQQSQPLRVDSLTAQGQLGGGRNIIVPAAESQAVNIAREALGQAKKTATAVTQLNEKIKGVTVLRGGV